MQAAGAHAHAKHAQSEPETGKHMERYLTLLYHSTDICLHIEHQVIQIQTQQAPIPSQAEVVLSDGKSKANPTPFSHCIMSTPIMFTPHPHTYVYQVMSFNPNHMKQSFVIKIFQMFYSFNFIIFC